MPLLLSSCATDVIEDPIAGYEEVNSSTVLDAPSARPGQSAPENSDYAARGEYLVELLGCGSCHTDGALMGDANTNLALAGSGIGIAWSNPMGDERPGIVYPPNITPDTKTGIGLRSDIQIENAIRAGVGNHGERRITVMPWQGYATISDDDIKAIVSYLRSIEPISHVVPDEVKPGARASAPYVYFGVFRSRQ